MERREIVVVGAGPTGLCCALALAREGLDVLVLEAEPELTVDLRAGSYHPPTIEMLAELGLADEMLAAGIRVPVWQIRDRIEGVVAEFDLALLADETPHPYRLHLEQHRLTPMLLERLRTTTAAEVRFAAPVEAVEPGDDQVIVTASGSRIGARWLIGCDGARSIVRRSLQMPFEGFTWPERFLVASTTHDLGRHGFAGAGYVADPDDWAAIFKMPGEGAAGLWRIAYPTDPAIAEEEVLAERAIRPRLARIMEHVDTDVARWDLRYRSTYRVHQRVAERFCRGRVLLAGDAAHINNPLGGFGLNSSIHDAVDLAEKLTRVIGDGESAELLDLYDRQRRPINIEFVQAISIRNKRLIEERDPEIRRQRLAEIRATAADPIAAKAYLMNSSMIASVRKAAAIT